MGTTDNRAFVDQLIAGNGRIDPAEAPDNPWCVKIVEYINMSGRKAWGMVFEGERAQDRYDYETEYIHNPRVIWRRKE